MKIDEESIESIQKIIPMLLWISLFYITESRKVNFFGFVLFGILFFIGRTIKYFYSSFKDRKFNYEIYYKFMKDCKNEFSDYGFSFILFTFIKGITKYIYGGVDKFRKIPLFISVICIVVLFFILSLILKKTILKKHKIKESNVIGFIFIIITFILYLIMGNIEILNGFYLKTLTTEILLIFFVSLPVKGFFLLEKKEADKENYKLKSKRGVVNSKSIDVILSIMAYIVMLGLAYVSFKYMAYELKSKFLVGIFLFLISLYFYDLLDEELHVFTRIKK